MRAFGLILFFVAYALLARWYFVCQIRGLCKPQPVETVIEGPMDMRLKTLALKDSSGVILSGFDHFAFDSASVFPRLNANNTRFLDSVALYLLDHPDLNLTITGAYRPGERAFPAGFFENIGVARANEARQLLIERGIAEGRISLDFAEADSDDLQRPLAFEVYAAKAPGDFAKVSFSFSDMTFSDANFATGSDEFRPGISFISYADSAKVFLDAHPDIKLLIIGHTDSEGSDKANQELGLRRAKSARQYFRELGIASGRIKTDSRGERLPVTSNDTPEGRQKNRRVNFILE